MDQETCNNIYNLIGSVGVGLLFIASEVLPFIKQVKSNGLAEVLYNNFLKKKNDKDQDEKFQEVIEYNFEDENSPTHEKSTQVSM